MYSRGSCAGESTVHCAKTLINIIYMNSQHINILQICIQGGCPLPPNSKIEDTNTYT